jgi:hypothetical protein
MRPAPSGRVGPHAAAWVAVDPRIRRSVARAVRKPAATTARGAIAPVKPAPVRPHKPVATAETKRARATAATVNGRVGRRARARARASPARRRVVAMAARRVAATAVRGVLAAGSLVRVPPVRVAATAARKRVPAATVRGRLSGRAAARGRARRKRPRRADRRERRLATTRASGPQRVPVKCALARRLKPAATAMLVRRLAPVTQPQVAGQPLARARAVAPARPM